jgi:NADH-quinone oxidoreductase subunit L
MFVGWAAIAGIPYLFAGFYSKEAILGAAVNQPLNDYLIGGLTGGQLAGWIGFFVAMLTAAYMTRMMMLTFGAGEERWRAIPAAAHHHHGDHAVHAHAHHEDPHGFFYTDEQMAERHEVHDEHHDLDSTHQPVKVPWEMLLPLVVLAALSLGVSAWFMENHHAFMHWLYPGAPAPPHDLIGKGALIGISTAVATLGIAYGYFTYHQKKLGENEGWDLSKWHPFRRSANRQFGIDDALAGGSVKTGGVLGGVLAWFDRWIIDGIVNLTGIVARSFAGTGKWFQTGYVRTYALVMQLGVAGVLLYAIYLWLQEGR